MRNKLLKRSSGLLELSYVDLFAGMVLAVFVILIVVIFAKRDKCEPEKLAFLKIDEMPTVLAGQNYLYTIPVSGGSGQRRFGIAGQLPPNLDFESNSGTIFGFAALNSDDSPASYPIVVHVIDDRGQTDTLHVELFLEHGAVPYDPEHMALRITRESRTLEDATVRLPYEAIVGASGGVEPYRWNLVGGMIPTGLALENGRITGVPTVPGKYEFAARVAHSPGTFEYNGQIYAWEGAADTIALEMAVYQPTTHFLVLPQGEVGRSYTGAIVSTNGTPEDRPEWIGTVPGLAVTKANRSLEGVPTEAGRFQISCAIATTFGHPDTLKGLIEIRESIPLEALPAVFQAWLQEPFESCIPHRGGVEPVRIQLLDDLPAGLTFEDGGKIAGIPESVVLRSIRYLLSDDRDTTVEGTFQIRVGPRH